MSNNEKLLQDIQEAEQKIVEKLDTIANDIPQEGNVSNILRVRIKMARHKIGTIFRLHQRIDRNTFISEEDPRLGKQDPNHRLLRDGFKPDMYAHMDSIADGVYNHLPLEEQFRIYKEIKDLFQHLYSLYENDNGLEEQQK